MPIDDRVMKRAATLWAWARATGQQTAHNHSIDIDVILAAQAAVLGEDEGDYVVIATSNVEHIQRYTNAAVWRDITVASCLNPELAPRPVLSQVNQRP